MTTTWYLPDGRYPAGSSERKRIRDEMREAIVTRAEAAASRAGRSPDCGGSTNPYVLVRHEGEPLGCPFPQTCICECHDWEDPS